VSPSRSHTDRLKRIAYADPPYIGCAHLYKDHPDYDGEVDHLELLTRLQRDYDGWALSASSRSLPEILGYLRGQLWPAPRILIWTKNSIRYAWEPVIIRSARTPGNHLRDWLFCEPDAFQWRPKPGNHVLGAKPKPFCMWLFEWLGAEPGDTLDDLFPGSGAVGRAWEEYEQQPQILRVARRESRRWDGLGVLDV